MKQKIFIVTTINKFYYNNKIYSNNKVHELLFISRRIIQVTKNMYRSISIYGHFVHFGGSSVKRVIRNARFEKHLNRI